jgi:ribosome-binding protein aMBF1 (putative translation factor)
MRKMISTFQKDTTSLPQPIVTSVLAPMIREPFDVATQQMPAVKTYQFQKNFIRNVEHVALRTTTNSRNFSVQNNIYILVLTADDVKRTTSRQCLEKRRKWRNQEYRQAYMTAAIEQGVAWQIKINREKRNLSQGELAQKIKSKQSAISRAEDPSYGRHRLETLVKIANAFDCALQVKFIPYSTLARESEDLSPENLYAKSYTEELQK